MATEAIRRMARPRQNSACAPLSLILSGCCFAPGGRTVFINQQRTPVLDESQYDKEAAHDPSMEGTNAEATNDCDWGSDAESPDPRVAVIGYN